MRISDWSSDVCSSDLHLIAVRRPAPQTPLQFLHRRRQDEDAHDIAARNLVQLLRALPVDVEQHVPPRLQHRLHRRPRRAVTLAKDMRSEENTSELQSLMRISYAVFCLTKTKKYN